MNNKKPKCLMCENPATITKEVKIALKYSAYGQYRPTGKMLDFCSKCFPHAIPVILCDKST